MKYVLASASPRRKEILENLGLDFVVITSEADENSEISDPQILTEELSRRKAEAVRDHLEKDGRLDTDTVIIASDTVVFAGGEILGKPHDKADAERMIRLLSGKTHTVTSGVALIYRGKTVSSHSTTEVTFDELDEEFIEDYVSSREPYDKAGAYAIQGRAAEVISKINGCYFNVVGLPVNRLIHLAKENNIPFELNH
ncbi:MAG: septum formation protein Maf [Clostridia bacterium]|nr:septum formation protein Maf [Clostridia bacterium]